MSNQATLGGLVDVPEGWTSLVLSYPPDVLTASYHGPLFREDKTWLYDQLYADFSRRHGRMPVIARTTVLDFNRGDSVRRGPGRSWWGESVIEMPPKVFALLVERPVDLHGPLVTMVDGVKR